jgi:hypothetical protein
VEISGDTTARSLPCTGPHVWETFAIGARAYRCLAHVLTGPDPAHSQFLR